MFKGLQVAQLEEEGVLVWLSSFFQAYQEEHNPSKSHLEDSIAQDQRAYDSSSSLIQISKFSLVTGYFNKC